MLHIYNVELVSRRLKNSELKKGNIMDKNTVLFDRLKNKVTRVIP